MQGIARELESRDRAKRAGLFALVCGLHVVLGWLVLAASRLISLHDPASSFELLVITPATVPLPTSEAVKVHPAAPSAVFRAAPRLAITPDEDANLSAGSKAITPPVDWNAELARAARAASGIEGKDPVKDFGFPTRAPTMADYPQFDWDYAPTHRVESLPEGGVVVHLNDNCVLVMTPIPFPFCSPFKRQANGDLFKHMRDPDKPGDARVP